MHKIEYNEVAQADLLVLDKAVRTRILRFFESRVATHPDPKRIAEPLTGALQGLNRFQIGPYRAVCHISDERLLLLVLFVDHRRAVYKRHVPADWADWDEDKV